MGARFRVVIVGRSRCGWADEAVEDYARRIRRFGGVDEVAVRQATYHGDVEAVRSAEADAVLGRLGERDRLVALDERGDRVDTDAFSAMVDAGRRHGPVVFAIGGPYGHSEAVRARAWRTVRLSDLVLNHEVARVVLYEQLYRALTLLEGVPYHH